MDMSRLLHLFPTMEIIAQELVLAGRECRAVIAHPESTYRNVRLFTGQAQLRPDILYALRPWETDFPTDQYSYVCTTPIEGSANHICIPGQTPEKLLDSLMELFGRFQDMESRIDQLVYQGSSLQELCRLGEELLENPMCIHDDWFIVIGMSPGAAQIMAPEYLMTSTKGFLPRVILDDFQHDSDYLETYDQTEPQIWHASPPAPSSLYVNLWDGSIYRGRLVIIEQDRSFRKADFILAQVLTQRAIFLLQRKLPGDPIQMKSMDDTVFSVLTGAPADPSDQARLLRLLNWEKDSAFACIRIRSQQGSQGAVLEHVLHSDLFRSFPGSYILLSGGEQCVVVNLDRSGIPWGHIPHKLAPLCRDYCLYAGVSSPVSGIQEWSLAYRQSGIALDRAFRLRGDKWILTFSQCALDHMLSCLGGGLQPQHMVAPELKYLAACDREQGTQYFETLREYLLQERDIPRTSRKLIIHRTTLLYRLKKILPMLSMDLEDPWQRLYLMLSLWILEQEDRK